MGDRPDHNRFSVAQLCAHATSIKRGEREAMMQRLISWDELRQAAEKRSKSQIRRAIRAGQFPAPAGHNGKSPVWTEQQWNAHVARLTVEAHNAPSAA